MAEKMTGSDRPVRPGDGDPARDVASFANVAATIRGGAILFSR